MLSMVNRIMQSEPGNVVRAILAIGALLTGLHAATAQAEGFPSRPVTIIVAFPPGGGTDIVARKLAQRLAVRWGQPVIVDNKAGAAGTIGTTAVARAEPNGYTLLMATLGNMAINQHLYAMEIDPTRDLAAVSNVVGVDFVMVTNPKLPASTLGEFLALARNRPAALNYSSSGIGGAPHMAAELFMSMTDTRVTQVPYKGSGPSIADLVGGQVDFSFDSLVQCLPQIQAGKLRALAVLGTRRSPLLPAVPTMAESGVPGYEFTNWFGLVAPARTPRDIVDKINADVVAVLSEPHLRSELEQMGAVVIADSPAQFATQIDHDSAKWGKIVAAGNIRAQ